LQPFLFESGNVIILQERAGGIVVSVLFGRILSKIAKDMAKT
jgi:hypothetical protein